MQAGGNALGLSGLEEQHCCLRYRMEASCLELALEGERLCKAGDFWAGVSFFEAAVQVGTEDLRTLSAIYSQLGNAYFYLGELGKALEYHRHDLTLARTVADQVGEAKASGNLGNTLKALGRYDEAAACCQRQLDISRESGDKVGEAKALYNLGNVYHTRGKQADAVGAHEPGELCDEARNALLAAAQCYDANLEIVRVLNDRAALGRAFGNLGNTQYLLGNYDEAVEFHQERLKIAKEFGDKAAEKRAYTNLGNTYVRLEDFPQAVEYYKKALQLARQLRERAAEAQACYSLGNTYTLLRDFPLAIQFFLKHLAIAQDLSDRVGEGRACWSLGNAYASLGNHQQALSFVTKHLAISKEVGDCNGELTARLNLADLQSTLGMAQASEQAERASPDDDHDSESDSEGEKTRPRRRLSMENMELMHLTPGKVGKPLNGDVGSLAMAGAVVSAQQNSVSTAAAPATSRPSGKSLLPSRLRGKKQRDGAEMEQRTTSVDSRDVALQVSTRVDPDLVDDDGFFDLLSRFQGNRMDDQRCSLGPDYNGGEGAGARGPSTPPLADRRAGARALVASPQTEEFLDLLACSQSRRIDDQRASVSDLPGLRLTPNNSGAVSGRLAAAAAPAAPRGVDGAAAAAAAAARAGALAAAAAAISHEHEDEDFFDMLVRCQSSRMDDQRCVAPAPMPRGPTVPDEDFISLIQRVQARRLDEQRVAPPPDLRE
ncbi:G-protein-signaling modulator 2-like isoform X1 [Lampetra fluviatilis]